MDSKGRVWNTMRTSAQSIEFLSPSRRLQALLMEYFASLSMPRRPGSRELITDNQQLTTIFP